MQGRFTLSALEAEVSEALVVDVEESASLDDNPSSRDLRPRSLLGVMLDSSARILDALSLLG